MKNIIKLPGYYDEIVISHISKVRYLSLQYIEPYYFDTPIHDWDGKKVAYEIIKPWKWSQALRKLFGLSPKEPKKILHKWDLRKPEVSISVDGRWIDLKFKNNKEAKAFHNEIINKIEAINNHSLEK